jgi:hypothetical protein
MFTADAQSLVRWDLICILCGATKMLEELP